MVFSSSVFLFAFFPLFLAIYFVVPHRTAKNIILLIFSLLFYAWGEPVYVFLMIGSILVNWAFALVLEKLGGGGIFDASTRHCPRFKSELFGTI